MQSKTTLHWQSGMAFESIIDGHSVKIDAAPDFGGQNFGVRPKQLIAVSLAGCTAMDFVSLMEKMRVNFTSFRIDVESTLNDEHPKKYNEIVLHFVVGANTADFDKIDKAIKLSEEKYCGVWATLKPGVKISYVVEFE